MNYPLDKYKFIQNGNKIIALSSYAGKTVRGVATCAPGDTFDIQKGKELAAARCAVKIAKKRYYRAAQKAREADAALERAEEYYNNMSDYHESSYDDYFNSMNLLDDILESM